VPISSEELDDDDIVMERLLDVVCAGELESVTCTVNEEIPVDVGFPLICAVDEFNANPTGRAPDATDHL
jgi:hypothetical protein